MFFTKASLAALALALFASAFPAVEERGLRKRVTQQPIANLNPHIGSKTVNLDGKHTTESYRRGTDLAPWVSLNVADVMAKWKDGTKQMNGPYIAVEGKAELATKWTGKEDTLFMECK